MLVRMQFEAQLQAVAGYSEDTIRLSKDAVVLDALKAVTRNHSELRERLVPNDEPSASVMIFINNEILQRQDASKRSLTDGDTVLLIPPISGG